MSVFVSHPAFDIRHLLFVIETEHFINTGYGWTCKHCRDETQEEESAPIESMRARFFTEGEAEEREPKLSVPALARWHDASRHTLVCPRCGVTERMLQRMKDEG